MLRTRSATVLALSWQCQRYSHTNNSAKNKKHCCSCRAWGDRIAPLSAPAHGNMCNKAGGIGNIGCNTAGSIGRVGLSFCSSKNNSPNKVSPRKVGTCPDTDKSGKKRNSPSLCNGSVAM